MTSGSHTWPNPEFERLDDVGENRGPCEARFLVTVPGLEAVSQSKRAFHDIHWAILITHASREQVRASISGGRDDNPRPHWPHACRIQNSGCRAFIARQAQPRASVD